MRALIQIAFNGVALWLAAHLVPGINYYGGLFDLLVAGMVFGLINLLVKPLVTLLSLPFIVITLGLFFVVINGCTLYLAALFLEDLWIDSFRAAMLGGVVIAMFNWMVRGLSGESSQLERRTISF